MAKNMALGQLITSEVLDLRILQAMDVPRETFVPEKLRGAAYVDEDLEIAPGRYLMASATFARLLALAGIEASSRVLVVGTLTGYPAAVIARLSSQVVAIETDAGMVAAAREKLAGLKNVRVEQVASLADGFAPAAPCDVIVIYGAVARIPEKLAAQLIPGGRLVAVESVSRRPDEPGGLGRGVLFLHLQDRLQGRGYFDAPARLLPGFAENEAFAF